MTPNFTNTIDALAVAIFAFETNQKKVVKEVTQWTDGKIKHYPNKHYLFGTFAKISNNPVYPAAVEITQDLVEKATALKTYVEQMVTMSMLTKGQVNPFVHKLFEMIKEDQLHFNNFGFIIWAPKVMLDGERASSIKEISAAFEHSSKYIGKVGERLSIEFTLIEKRYVRSVDTWSAYGHDDQGNLISFLTKKEELIVSGSIKGRIKAHEQSRFHNNAKITQLNHVKQ